MLPYFHRFSVCMEGQVKTIGIRYLWTRILKKKKPDMCGHTGPNTYLPPINCSQVFLTVEHTAVVGAEILKEKETTKKHKNDSSMDKLHT